MQEHEQLAQLRRMRRIATGLLVLMALLFLVARLLRARHAGLPGLALVDAFAEAAMVGALADWFAVTALFRHPFGLPIPHTAIIASNKDRIGASVANFLQHNFMTREVLREELARVDFAGTAAHWMDQAQNRRALAAQAAGAVPALLRLADDDDVARFVHTAVADALEGVQFAPLLADALSVLVAGGQHLILFEQMLGFVSRALEQHRPYIRQKVHEHSPGWIPRAIDDKLYERLMEGVQGILAEIQSEGSEWRVRFQAATEELIANLASSPEYEEKLQAIVAASLGHPLVRSYAGQVWQSVRARLLADAAAPDSRLARAFDDALAGFGKALANDMVIREKLNAWLREVVADTVVLRRDVIASVVERVIRKWDAETVSRKFELHVGKDLQFIRINGTLVGGLVGLLLHALTRLL
jgi:uncharacterized membrane-anchored protein YjiN (DUF445 family)